MTTYEYTLTTGIFEIPGGAQYVNWTLLNDSDVEQAYRVTAYNCPGGAPKQAAAPGPLGDFLLPGVTAHYAGEIGIDSPFSGVAVEVVVEVNDHRMLPTVEIWSGGTGDTVIPGTQIGPGQFVRLS